MPETVVLSTTARLHPQLIQDTLVGREAIEIIRDWIAQTMRATATVRSWTPYWKEIKLNRPGNISVVFRFRLGGPVLVSESSGWTISKIELAEFEQKLVAFLSNLAQALTQQRVADAIQSHYPDATREVRDDDTILMQFRVPRPTALHDPAPGVPIDMAVIVQPSQTIGIYARCGSDEIGRAAIRRLRANLQVAGISLGETATVVVSR